MRAWPAASNLCGTAALRDAGLRQRKTACFPRHRAIHEQSSPDENSVRARETWLHKHNAQGLSSKQAIKRFLIGPNPPACVRMRSGDARPCPYYDEEMSSEARPCAATKEFSPMCRPVNSVETVSRMASL